MPFHETKFAVGDRVRMAADFGRNDEGKQIGPKPGICGEVTAVEISARGIRVGVKWDSDYRKTMENEAHLTQA